MSTDRSAVAVATLAKRDPQFTQLCELLYGPGVDPTVVWHDVFGKMSPDQADLNVPGAPQINRRRKALAVAALGSTGAGGVIAADKLLRSTGRGRLLPAAALAGDVLATGEIADSTRTLFGRRKQPVAKAGLNQLVRGSLTQHRRLVRATLDASKPPGRSPARYAARGPAKTVEKRVDADWAGEFSKLEPDKRLALGWANVCKVNGMPVVDRQGDYIDAEDLEDAVYAYVERSRVGGDMHDRSVGKNAGRGLWFGLYDPQLDEPRHVADLVESVIITKAKKDAMGLPEEFPEGWWVGFRYHDDDVWESIKKGERRGFSIHGSGLRKSIEYDRLMAGQ